MTFDPWGKEEPPDDPYDEPELSDDEKAMLAASRRAAAIERRAYDLRVTEEARRLVAREQRADRPPPRLINLADFLAEDDTDPVYRIDGLWPTGGRILVAAQFKAGKTTVVANLLRSLADGDQFLERFDVRQAEHIVLIDDELDERTLRHWLRAQGIQSTASIDLVSLRGNVAAFDLLDPEIRAEWSKRIAGADVLIIDCLRPILDALGLDENHDAGRFLVALDTMMSDASCSDGLLVHHMGHSGERSRGDSRLNDWPDAIWKLVRDKDEENPDLDDVSGSRYFSAFGRDVDWPQSELTYDAGSRRLSIGEAAPNRKLATARKNARVADEAVMHAISEKPGLTKRGLREACKKYGATHHQDVDDAVERLVENGRIWRQKNGAAQLHWPGNEPESAASEGGVPNVPNLFSDDLGTPAAKGGASVPFRAPPAGHTLADSNVPNADRAQTQDWAHPDPQPAKTCPECDVTIPRYQTRCGPCTVAFVERNRGVTSS